MPSSSFDKHFAHLRISLEEIKSATNSFSDAHLIRTGGFGQEYEGQLERSGQLIDIVARRYDSKYGQGKKEFQIALLMLSTLNHENLVCIIGFCDEGVEQIIINKHDAKGSLDQYLGDPSLTWIRRLEICVGVARALSYIHYDKQRDFSVIHRNIKSSNILLDDNGKPKLSGFELSMKTTSRTHRLLLSRACGTLGYIDPMYEKTGGVTHKSDVYSFGVVLFEVLCGRTASINPQGFSAQLAKHHSKKGSLDEGRPSSPAKQGSIETSPAVVQQLAKPLSWMGVMKTTSFTDLPSSPSSSANPSSRPTSIVDGRWSVFSDLYGQMAAAPPSLSAVKRMPISYTNEGPEVNSQESMHMFTVSPSARFRPNLHISDEELLAPLAISGYDEGKLDDMIDPHLRKQMDPQSFQVFSEIAYYCLKEQRSQRPDMALVFLKLNEALDHQLNYENPLKEHSEATSTNHLKGHVICTSSMSKGLSIITCNFLYISLNG